ncbi:hypothetical protein BEI61_03996 [Eisenbergiella tayi]|uniref:Restriction endonuclease type IV Mrr domain-containing protein n=2 Tax=Eisenbergiella tayi TaxID=1432052 RepID=A0A1E3A343_9FIRM|nr:hypothetical protein BEI61_03996 [Eisenbergiella tayi]
MLKEPQIQQLNDYFAGLIGGATENITVSKISEALNWEPSLASKVLAGCKRLGIVSETYGIRCPECSTLIQRIETLDQLPQSSFECYACGEEITITTQDIEVLFSLINPMVFLSGQQENEILKTPVAQENSLDGFLKLNGINEYFFCPTEDEYEELDKMYTRIFVTQKTKKDTGDTLEKLVIYMFGLCRAFRTNGIKTTTNQIDCYVRNSLFIPYGVFNTIGRRFVIECKNENKVPKGDYMSKLHSIIHLMGSDYGTIKFGIIVSKVRGPSTFRALANKVFLKEKLIIISINGKEIKNLIDCRGNLLEMIERKIDEVTMDATTDLVEAGLYNT